MDDETMALVPIRTGTIPFYGDAMTAALVVVDGQPCIYAALRPICERLGLDWSAQRQRIKRSTVLRESIRSVVITPTEGVSRTALCLPDHVLHGWLFGVDEHRVSADARLLLLRYQRECYAALHAHFTKVQPAATPTPALSPPPSLSALTRQIAALQTQAATLAEELAQIRRAPTSVTAAHGRTSVRPLHTAARAILDTVTAAGVPMTPATTTAALGQAGHTVDRAYVRVRMGRLVRSGYLIRVGHGQYIVAPESVEARP